MLPAKKQIILANMHMKLYSCTLTFHKVVWQQMWGEAVVLIRLFCTSFLNLTAKELYENWPTIAKVIVKIKVCLLFGDRGGYYATE